MTIHIIDAIPDLYLTRSEHARLCDEYNRAFAFYAGTPPAFEEWAHDRLRQEHLARGSVNMLNNAAQQGAAATGSGKTFSRVTMKMQTEPSIKSTTTEDGWIDAKRVQPPPGMWVLGWTPECQLPLIVKLIASPDEWEGEYRTSPTISHWRYLPEAP